MCRKMTNHMVRDIVTDVQTLNLAVFVQLLEQILIEVLKIHKKKHYLQILK